MLSNSALKQQAVNNHIYFEYNVTSVWIPAIPSTYNPFSFWNFFTAISVTEPKSPSA